jgi:hypothetical protein
MCARSAIVRTPTSSSSSDAVTASSTWRTSRSSASCAGTRQTRPSAIVSIGRSMARFAWKLSTIAGEPFACTAMTRACGCRCLTAMATPLASEPLPIGT